MTPVFVVGVPRSGTTLLGAYIASHPAVFDMREYFAFYNAMSIVPNTFARVPSNCRVEYLRSLIDHAAAFAKAISIQNGCNSYCDSTPWNVLVADQLSALLPLSRWVLVIRSLPGVAQSLEGAFLRGYRWAGESWVDRARLWATFYNAAVEWLPAERTIAVSYDRLCADPHSELKRFHADLDSIGINEGSLDPSVFARSHATSNGEHKATIGVVQNGKANLLGRSTHNAATWTTDIERATSPYVAATRDALQRRFPICFSSDLEVS